MAESIDRCTGGDAILAPGETAPTCYECLYFDPRCPACGETPTDCDCTMVGRTPQGMGLSHPTDASDARLRTDARLRRTHTNMETDKT